ncbi:MAG: FtsX-like permease family protein, partial [bacterium]|nr:FtsX-like permease family protein [bacterium]
LARGTARGGEIAVRLALGASRARLVRLFLVESLAYAAAGGILGFVFAFGLVGMIPQLGIQAPRLHEVSVDGRVLGVMSLVTICTGVLFGLAPALQATRTDLTPALKEGGTIRLRKYRRLSLRNMLVLHQVAGSLMLLLLTGTIVVGYQRTMGTEVGFDPADLYLVSLDPIRDGYSGEQSAAFFQRLLEGVQRHAGVRAASLTETVPTALSGSVSFSAAGPGAADTPAIHRAQKCVVGKDYFHTAGIPILLGRGFRRQDETSEAAAVIVNETLVSRFWPGEDPLGRRIETGKPE